MCVVGSAVTSDIRGLQFESRHRQFYLLSTVLNKLYRTDKNEDNSGPEWAD